MPGSAPHRREHGSLYVKGNKLWIRYKDESGKWVGAPTQCRPDEKVRARRHLVKVESTIQALNDARKAVDLPPGAPLTVTAYCEKWLADRKRLGIKSLQDDISRMRLHILPRIGTMLMQEVRPRHMREMVLQLREAGKLAPRTLCNVYHLSATMFRTAVAEEIIDATRASSSAAYCPRRWTRIRRGAPRPSTRATRSSG